MGHSGLHREDNLVKIAPDARVMQRDRFDQGRWHYEVEVLLEGCRRSLGGVKGNRGALATLLTDIRQLDPLTDHYEVTAAVRGQELVYRELVALRRVGSGGRTFSPAKS